VPTENNSRFTTGCTAFASDQTRLGITLNKMETHNKPSQMQPETAAKPKKEAKTQND
jgi:hypothetical protein